MNDKLAGCICLRDHGVEIAGMIVFNELDKLAEFICLRDHDNVHESEGVFEVLGYMLPADDAMKVKCSIRNWHPREAHVKPHLSHHGQVLQVR